MNAIWASFQQLLHHKMRLSSHGAGKLKSFFSMQTYHGQSSGVLVRLASTERGGHFHLMQQHDEASAGHSGMRARSPVLGLHMDHSSAQLWPSCLVILQSNPCSQSPGASLQAGLIS